MTREPLSPAARQVAARALVDNPLWPDMLELTREEIARAWLEAKDDAERVRLAAVLEGAAQSFAAIQRAANNVAKRR